MTKKKRQTTFRLRQDLIGRMEAAREPERNPVASAFMREAVRGMMREEKRNRVREQMKRASRDPEEVELSRQMAEAGLSEWAESVWGQKRELDKTPEE